MAITDKDVEKLKGVFATKEDLNRFATKDEMNIDKLKLVFATKEDLRSFRNEVALRFDELKNVFATKEDLKAFATRDEILTRLDKILGEQEKTKGDKILAKDKDDKQDLRLDDLELKVKGLEEKVGV